MPRPATNAIGFLLFASAFATAHLALYGQVNDNEQDWRFNRLEETDFIWRATERFENALDSKIPYYSELNRGSLAIDASYAAYRDTFARATSTVLAQEAGTYRMTLVTLTETDGESEYRVLHNGTPIGSFTNPQTEKNSQPAYFSIPKIQLQEGDSIEIESNAVTNGKIPEGNGTAYSRGRWIGLAFQGL